MQADPQACWVPAAIASDILTGTVVPAHAPSGPIAVWRSASGQLYANGDRCPHRGMRLSHGFVRGESLSCIYHGWRYGPDGACQHIPAHPNVVPPKTINCGPLPVAEQNGVVWVAAVPTDDAPPVFAGYSALRSVMVNATIDAVQAAGQSVTADGAVAVQLGDLSARLLLNAQDPTQVSVIALVDDTASVADRIAASAALDAMRRRMEADAAAAHSATHMAETAG